MKVLATILAMGLGATTLWGAPGFSQGQALSKIGGVAGDVKGRSGQTGAGSQDKEETGTISGKVTDRKGNALAGVDVKLVEPGNEDESVVKVVTDMDGEFSIESVPVAVYDVKAGKGGHVGVTLSGIVILPNKELMLRMVMNELVLE